MKTLETVSTLRPSGVNGETLKAAARKEDILVAMYSGLPEPPTLNALLVLSKWFRSVLFFRNKLEFPIENYLHQPLLKEIGLELDTRDAAKKNTLWKLSRFANYCLALYKELRSKKYRLVIFHDYLSLLAFWLVKRWSGYNGLTWFNSYDVLDMQKFPVGRFSLISLVVRNHGKIFSELDYFSLPALERKQYYPVNKVKRETFFIPNFPAASYYAPHYQPKKMDEPVIKLIYQGALGKGHGYENIIGILDKTIHGKPLQLILKGWIAEEYKEELIRLAESRRVGDRLRFEGFSAYSSVRQLASTCTAGLAIFTGNDIMNKTLATASNKIYEYMAVGMPVILYDTPHFREYFEGKPHFFFTDLSEQSLLSVLENIAGNYEAASASAFGNFMEHHTFEKVFTPALVTVIKALGKKGIH